MLVDKVHDGVLELLLIACDLLRLRETAIENATCPVVGDRTGVQGKQLEVLGMNSDDPSQLSVFSSRSVRVCETNLRRWRGDSSLGWRSRLDCNGRSWL